jgi:hypothetical protein
VEALLGGGLVLQFSGVGDEGLVEERDRRAGRELVALGDALLSDSFEVGAELAAHVVGDMDVDRVHALHGVAAAVHLGDFGYA